MNFDEDIEIILKYAYVGGWLSDLIVFKDVYKAFSDSYSILTPFAYSYLEELIRSTTSEYGIEVLEKNGISVNHKVGKRLIELAKRENAYNLEYINALDNVKCYFLNSTVWDTGDNRNSVDHGYLHPIRWKKEFFEKLVHDIAIISPYNKF